ncbi:MAG: ApaG domain-containing protein [Muribaculaceae bacterium]|nr:ApaG domain-containing protein [Muribaculaceae bacterium]
MGRFIIFDDEITREIVFSAKALRAMTELEGVVGLRPTLNPVDSGCSGEHPYGSMGLIHRWG